VVCGQLFCTKHLAIQHCAGEFNFLALYRWWSFALLTNVEDLNSYHDSCAGITKVEICVV
jgi:hypothetical protein